MSPRGQLLRNHASALEQRAWKILRRLRDDGFHIRRQHPVGPYFVDFAVVKSRLAIEIDGGVHDLLALIQHVGRVARQQEDPIDALQRVGEGLGGDLLQAFDQSVKLIRKLPRGPVLAAALARVRRWLIGAQQSHGGSPFFNIFGYSATLGPQLHGREGRSAGAGIDQAHWFHRTKTKTISS